MATVGAATCAMDIQRMSSNPHHHSITTSESDTTAGTTEITTTAGITYIITTKPSSQEEEQSRCEAWCAWRSHKLLVHSTSILPAETSKVTLEKVKVAMENQLHIERDRGSLDELSIDECNISFIEKFYTDITDGVHSWPLIIPTRNASESVSDILSRGKQDRLYYDRRSDIAEQKTFNAFLTMLKYLKIPSFTIYGYEWEQALPEELSKVFKSIKSTDEKSTNDMSTSDKSTDDKSTYDKSTHDKCTNDKSSNDKSTNDKSLNDKSTKGKATNDMSTDHVSTNDKDDKSPNETFTKNEKIVKEGKNDILVLLPLKGVLSIEVKSHDINKRRKNLGKDIRKCAEQCMKLIQFVAFSTLDIAYKKPFCYVKIASFPNISRKDIESMVCEDCSKCFITKDDLHSEDTLSKWFYKILELLNGGGRCEFDWEVYKGMVGRFIGPLSRVQVESMVGVINKTHNQLASLSTQFTWARPNKKRTKALLKAPKFLWIKGDPSIVKTTLLQWKLHEILKSVKTEEHIIYLITQDEMLCEDMETLLQSDPRKNVNLKKESFDNIFESNCQNFEFLLDVMKKLTTTHPKSDVSILIDKFWLDGDNPHQIPITEWKEKTLQNVWIIQNSANKMTPEPSNLTLLGFQIIRLKSVRSFSSSNVAFLNEWLKKHPMEGRNEKPFEIECMRPHKSKFVEFTKKQNEMLSANPSFLWITGDHGSGKTILALWKVYKLLKSAGQEDKECIIYFIAGNEDFMFIQYIKSLFDSDKSINVQLKIESIENAFRSYLCDVKGLLNVIKRLTSLHPVSYVSIIIDEFWLVNDNNTEKTYTNWKKENLKNVWIIQNPACKIIPTEESLKLLPFRTVCMNSVIRLSASNVNFINEWLKTNFEVGHAFAGPLPILLKMECICEKLQAEHGGDCTPFLITKLTETVLNDWGEFLDEDEFNISEDVVIITQMHFEVKKLLTQKHLEIPSCASLFFTGCEKKVVIVDLRRVGGSGEYRSILLEALTRTTGRLVLFDVSCKTRRRHRQEEAIESLLGRLSNLSQTFFERRGSVHLSSPEISAVQREIDLRWHRDEQYVQANARSAATVKILQDAIKPLQDDISEIKEMLQKGYSQTQHE